MQDFTHELMLLCRHNCDGSYATQADRLRILNLIADHLRQLGFVHLQADRLKPRHIDALVERWKQDGISPGTFKNRMASLRWIAEKIGKRNIVARSNAAYGIADRVYVTNVSKAQALDTGKLEKITDPYTAMSLESKKAFGLRREESIKWVPARADRDGKVFVEASWSKGGRSREIPITTAYQREVLNAAKALAGKGSLIPKGMTYVQQLQRFKAQCRAAGIHHVHGLRHQYAQERYQALTGWPCPAKGGPTSKQLTPEQKAIDREARLTISRELGHAREQVTAIYLGR